MVTPACAKCKQEIPPDDVNVAKDVAFCRRCNMSHALSALTSGTALGDVDLANPPAGAWYRDDGAQLSIGASTKSVGGAIGLTFFGLFWNGIVSVFVVVALASTMNHLGVSVPHWFPAPKMNGSTMGVGMTLFLWVFLTPFILVGLLLVFGWLMCVAGHTEVTIREAEGVAFTGIGSVGWRNRFDASAVKDVRIEDKKWRDSDGDARRSVQIVIEADKSVKLGSGMPDERRKFVAAALRKVLVG